MIYAYPPRIHPSGSSVCVKVAHGGYEVSIHMDNSGGKLKRFSRSDIRVYRECDGQDVTAEFVEGDASIVPGEFETLLSIMNKIDKIASA